MKRLVLVATIVFFLSPLAKAPSNNDKSTTAPASGNPGTAFYAGYNDDLVRNGFSPFTGQLEPGLRRNGRTFFIKLSYLFRRSFGG